MKKSIFTIAILLSIFSITFISCSDDDNDDNGEGNGSVASSYTLTIDGVTATEFTGEIIVCPDGYYIINGKAPDGSNLTIQSGKILVNETRSFCDARYLEEEEYTACIEDNGFSISGLFMGEIFHSSTGTATRTSTNNIEMSGNVWYMNDPLIDHTFTLEATASFVSPINCE